MVMERVRSAWSRAWPYALLVVCGHLGVVGFVSASHVAVVETLIRPCAEALDGAAPGLLPRFPFKAGGAAGWERLDHWSYVLPWQESGQTLWATLRRLAIGPGVLRADWMMRMWIVMLLYHVFVVWAAPGTAINTRAWLRTLARPVIVRTAWLLLVLPAAVVWTIVLWQSADSGLGARATNAPRPPAVGAAWWVGVCVCFSVAHAALVRGATVAAGTREQVVGHCPSCGYDRGETRVCPECGHARADDDRVMRRHVIRWWRRVGLVSGALALTAPVWVGWLCRPFV